MYKYKIRNEIYHPCLEMFKIILPRFHDEDISWWIENKGRGIIGPLWQIVARLRNFVESMVAREINPPPLLLRLLSRCHPFIARVPLYTRVRLRPHWKHLVLETGFKRSNELWSWANWDCGKTRLYLSLSLSLSAGTSLRGSDRCNARLFHCFTSANYLKQGKRERERERKRKRVGEDVDAAKKKVICKSFVAVSLVFLVSLAPDYFAPLPLWKPGRNLSLFLRRFSFFLFFFPLPLISSKQRERGLI